MSEPRKVGRPRKAGALRMDTDIRIPMTTEQKAVIMEATKGEPDGMAEWARMTLLTAAKRKLVKPKRSV